MTALGRGMTAFESSMTVLLSCHPELDSGSVVEYGGDAETSSA
jgi:hypothetical protein